ncbi:putative 6-phosphogluconolactonase 4, chloroplastic [Iris pallida]|uniref:Probable 6-phosphogluconolactonase n=1 Tax=Iris pallida TaxID=29817 RepID=A0AAX6G1W7_IRIPA|nr:putative 6-phosphogluconolactonase 4, chloroplastic [Iris pallida]
MAAAAVQVFATEEAVANGLAKYTSDLSKKFIHRRGAFTVVLSGGYLIKSIRKLLEPPYVDEVDWAKWHVFWVDERVVHKTHPDSNYKLAYDGFLSKVPIPPKHIYAINDSLSADDAADDYELRLKQLVKSGVLDVSTTTGFPRFDLMLLGMGPDGHLASLFPKHHLLRENQRWVAFTKDSPKPPPVRITFTFPVINASAHVAMVVVGTGEVDAVGRALGRPDSSSDLLPVQMVTLEDGEFIWFTDKEATSKLGSLYRCRNRFQTLLKRIGMGSFTGSWFRKSKG